MKLLTRASIAPSISVPKMTALRKLDKNKDNSNREVVKVSVYTVLLCSY